jgi:hypothetical protein
MILYNVTITIDTIIKDEWLEWMKTKHIPDVLATGCFDNARIFRVTGTDPRADGGISYAVQYYSPSWDSYERYRRHYAEALQREHQQRYGDRFVALRTVLEEQ